MVAIGADSDMSSLFVLIAVAYLSGTRASVARLSRSKAWVAFFVAVSGVSSRSWVISTMPGVFAGRVAMCLAMLFQSIVPEAGQR